MSSIKNLEMAAAISSYQHIEIKKSLFSTKAIYTPTQSLAKAIILEYSPSQPAQRTTGTAPWRL